MTHHFLSRSGEQDTQSSTLSFLHDVCQLVYAHHEHYVIRHLAWNDEQRQSEYQRLRAETFVRELDWGLPVDDFGRERDHYDDEGHADNSVHCVYGQVGQEEYLLAGLRMFQLRNWGDSMITQEFARNGMIPQDVLERLTGRYACTKVMEMNRMCAQRGSRYTPVHHTTHFNLAIARDLAYAAIYTIIEHTERRWVVGIVHPGYLRALKKDHSVFDLLYAQRLDDYKHGYALVAVDPVASLHVFRKRAANRVHRLLALCTNKERFS